MCSGKCSITKTEFKVPKNISYKIIQGGDGCGKPKNKWVRTALDKIVDKHRVKSDGCKGKNCTCVEIPDQKPVWGPWRKSKIKTKISARRGRLNCIWEISASVEIRRAVLDGICYDDLFEADISMIFLPELDIEIAMKGDFVFNEKLVENISKAVESCEGVKDA